MSVPRSVAAIAAFTIVTSANPASGPGIWPWDSTVSAR